MKVFLIILMILAILFACYELVMFIIDIRKKVAQKRQKQKEENDKENSSVDADRKE